MKKHMYIISLLFVVTFISCESDKLDINYYGTINGTVIDSKTYLPLQGAQISTTPASIAVLSDVNGKFIIPKIKEGDVAVNIKMQDYLSNSLTVAIVRNETTTMDFLIFKDDSNTGTISIYDPVPGNGAVDQLLALTFKWKMEGNKQNMQLEYNIYIFESNSTVQQLLGENVVLQEVTTSGLKLGTTYFWYVIAKSNGVKVAYSPTWTFKTKETN